MQEAMQEAMRKEAPGKAWHPIEGLPDDAGPGGPGRAGGDSGGGSRLPVEGARGLWEERR